jgi:biotin carboxylase
MINQDNQVHSQDSRPTALVLGGTFPHIRLLHNLRARGYRTVLVDYHENPCAKSHADFHYKESTLNFDQVVEIAHAENASLVISACIDQANLIACSVAETLGLPHPYDSSQAAIVTNKPLMKNFMRENGIPSSAFVIADMNGFSPDLDLKLPVIVKPADCNSSKGIVKINTLDQLEPAFRNAATLSRSGEVVIEEFVEGREIGIDCYISEGKPHILITKIRRKIPAEACNDQQIYGCFWPADLSRDESEAVYNVAYAIATSLDLKNSPLMIQAILSDQGIKVIEFAARFGGGESVKIIELATGVDIVDLSIRSFLHEPVKLKINNSKRFFAETFIYAKECAFDRIELQDPDLLNHTIDYLHQYKTPGMAVGGALTSNNRVGCFIVSGKTISELHQKINRVVDSLSVMDKNNRESFKYDIYTHECE